MCRTLWWKVEQITEGQIRIYLRSSESLSARLFDADMDPWTTRNARRLVVAVDLLDQRLIERKLARAVPSKAS